VLADPLQLQQVLTNLVINARDAMSDGGRLTLRADVHQRGTQLPFGYVEDIDGYVHLTVSDTGGGIAEEAREHIFEPLFTTKKNGGTGLGLAVVRQILDAHKAKVFVENLAKGTAFHLFLPLGLHVVADAPASEEPAPTRARRVLIVEDDTAVAAGLEAILECIGIGVDIVGTGRAAAGAIERSYPDVVILDLGLPDIPGEEVYAGIARRWPTLPVIFSTGHGNEAKLAQFLEHEHVEFLMKPYEIAELLWTLERVMPSVA
jgi:CheY-like chemotaxis protein